MDDRHETPPHKGKVFVTSAEFNEYSRLNEFHRTIAYTSGWKLTLDF